MGRPGARRHDLVRVSDARRCAGRSELGDDSEEARGVSRGIRWSSIPRGWHGSHRRGSTSASRTPGSFAIGSRSRARSATRRAYLAVQKEFGSFDAYVWGFVEGAPPVQPPASLSRIPARTAESDALSRDLLRRGFKFVGSTICYAFMQAVGLVNDHTTDCFRHALVGRSHPGARKKPMEIGEDPR